MSLLDEACKLVLLLRDEWTPPVGTLECPDDIDAMNELRDRIDAFLARAVEAGDVEARTIEVIASHLEAMADAEIAGSQMVTHEQRNVLEHRQLALLAAADEIRSGAWRPK